MLISTLSLPRLKPTSHYPLTTQVIFQTLRRHLQYFNKPGYVQSYGSWQYTFNCFVKVCLSSLQTLSSFILLDPKVYSYLLRDWKIHKIIPVFKSGDPTQVKNHRPISLLCNISKVLERIIYNKLINHVSSQINPAQFGFMQNWSTTQQSLTFLSNAFTVHHQLDTIYLDISKAFNIICHSYLLQSCPCIIYLVIYGSGSKTT